MIPARMTMSLSSGPSPVGSNSKGRERVQSCKETYMQGKPLWTHVHTCRHPSLHTHVCTYIPMYQKYIMNGGPLPFYSLYTPTIRCTYMCDMKCAHCTSSCKAGERRHWAHMFTSNISKCPNSLVHCAWFLGWEEMQQVWNSTCIDQKHKIQWQSYAESSINKVYRISLRCMCPDLHAQQHGSARWSLMLCWWEPTQPQTGVGHCRRGTVSDRKVRGMRWWSTRTTSMHTRGLMNKKVFKRQQFSLCALQCNHSIKNTPNKEHLSNEDTVCCVNQIETNTNLPLN